MDAYGVVPEPRAHDRPAVVMVAAPVLGAVIWTAILFLMFG